MSDLPADVAAPTRAHEDLADMRRRGLCGASASASVDAVLAVD